MKSAFLFAYGRLQSKRVQAAVLGHAAITIPDRMQKFTLVTEQDLARLDTYEGPAYQRKRVALESGVSAWVYTQCD